MKKIKLDCIYRRISLQVVDVCKEVLFSIAVVKVAETAEHKLGLFE
jgi:hypothetical protein